MKRTIWIILLAFALLACIPGPVVAQENGPAMQVTVGFDGHCRGGDWCPLYVVLTNDGADVDGELRVAVRSAGGGPGPHVYARRVVLPAHSRKAYFMILPSVEYPARTPLTVELVAGDDVLSSEQAAVTWLDTADRLYGVVSSNPSALNFLSDVAPSGGRAAVAHLDLGALPPDPLGWQGLDVLVLNDVDTSALGAAQRRALETWVAHGGHLVVGGGAGAARTAAGVADLLPIALGTIRSVDDLWALGERMGAPSVVGPYAVAEASLRDGEVLVEQGDLILLARRAFGAGQVDFVAFDAALKPFTRWDDNARLWEWIVGTAAAGTQRLTVRDGYRARDAVNAIPGLELPSMLYILAFMLVYTLLIGPVNYVVLRRLDRRELAWLTIPALIVGFTAFAYLTGLEIRGGRPILHRLAVVYVPQGSGVGRASEVVGLFSPRRTSYDVGVAHAGMREMPGGDYGAPAGQSLYVVEEAGSLTVTGLRVDVGGVQPFVVEGFVDVAAVDADLRLVTGASGDLRVEGTLRNSRLPLEEAVLIVSGGEQRLGALGAGEEASVQVLYRDGLGRPGTLEQILGPGDYWEDPELYRRYQFLQALSLHDRSNDGLNLGRGVYLVGWAGEVPLSVEVVGRPFSAVGTALYVYALPVAGLDETTRIP